MSEEFPEAEVACYWNSNADAWAREVRQGHDLAREHLNNPAFLEFIGDLSGKDVLDAGCGEGYNTRILAQRGARMTGIDIAERMLDHAARKSGAPCWESGMSARRTRISSSSRTHHLTPRSRSWR